MIMRQRYKAFLAENVFVIEQALSQTDLAKYWCFLFPFFFSFLFFTFDSTRKISSGNIKHIVLVNDLFIIRPKNK